MPRVAYVLAGFPRISESFVLNEMLRIREHGWEPAVFPLEVVHEGVRHPGADEARDHVTPISHQPGWRSVVPLLRLGPTALARWWRAQHWARRMGGSYAWQHRALARAAVSLCRARCHRVHVHFGGRALRAGVLLAKDAGIPVSVTLHRYDIFDRPLPDLGRLLAETDVCVTVSEYNRRYLEAELGIPRGRIRVIPNGVDVERFSPDPGTARVPGRILTVARLAPEKGLHYMVDALAGLVRAGVQCHWRIIGEGPERASLEAAVRDRGLGDRVTLLGARDSDEVLSELRRAELFVLPSLSEAAGVANLEAMATGVPVVATDVLGMSEYVAKGRTGVLVRPGSAPALREAVRELLESPERRAALGRAARASVCRHFAHADQASSLVRCWEGDDATG